MFAPHKTVLTIPLFECLGSSLRHLDRFDAKECLDKLNQLNIKAGPASSEQRRFEMRGK